MTQIANVYAQALYTLAKDEGAENTVLEQLKALDESFSQEPQFLRLMAAPNLSKEERCEILDKSFRDKVHPYALNFMKLLTRKGYMRYFGDCCKAYRELYYEDNGILEVSAVTAVALTQEQSAKLKDKLAAITGKTIELNSRTDPSCLGGVRLDFDGKRLDGTVKNRLDSIAALLKNTVL